MTDGARVAAIPSGGVSSVTTATLLAYAIRAAIGQAVRAVCCESLRTSRQHPASTAAITCRTVACIPVEPFAVRLHRLGRSQAGRRTSC